MSKTFATIVFGSFCFASSLLASPSADAKQLTGLSLFGDLKYGEGFKHFDYVNVKAPIGGKVVISAIGGFDSLNQFIIKGRPPALLGLIYDSLLHSSLDEPASAYGLIAKNVELIKNAVIFNLRPEASFHDGKPISADDVIWTFNKLRQAHPFYKAYYRDVVKVEKINSYKVKFNLSPNSNKELPFILGQFPILPKHYWVNRNFNETSMDRPLGSGAYKISKINRGRAISYQRVKNYWGSKLAVNLGRNNIKTIKVEYFGDAVVAFEAFKAQQINFYLENRASNWAVGYEGIKKNKNLVKKQQANKNPAGMQGFAFNLRREKFADIRVRKAFNYAFNFEWINRNFFHQSYRRSSSYFEGSELAARGVPKEAALELLKPFKAQLPKDIWTRPFKNPKTNGRGDNRTQLRKATKLFKEAGFQVRNNKLVKNGKKLEVTFLLISPTFEKIVLSYKRQLEKLGVGVKVQIVDPAQYSNRLRNYNFDIIVHNFAQSLSPGNEQRDFWSKKAANLIGGRNLIGIKNNVVDALVEKLIAAQTRAELVAATKALDFVLLSGHYVVPHWFLPFHRIAYWRGLSHPKKLPDYDLGFPQIWWMEK